MLGLSPIARNKVCSYNPTFSIATNPTRVPERLFPGRCDLWGHSHQVPFQTHYWWKSIFDWDSDVICEEFNLPDITISWPIQVWRKFIDKGTRFQLDYCIFSKSPPCQIFHILVVAGALAHLKVTDFCSFFLVFTFFLVVSCCSIYVGLSKPQHCPGSGSDGRLPLAPGILLCNLIEANKYSNYSVQLHC